MAERKNIGLPGGPNEFLQDITQYISVDGYKRHSDDVTNPVNIIESGSITMEDVDFPIMGTDNLGNSQMMFPENEYQFSGDMVMEIPMAQIGLPEHLQGIDLTQINDENSSKINSEAYRNRLKTEYFNAHNIELSDVDLDNMVSELNNQLTLGADEGTKAFYTQNVPDPLATAGFMFSGPGQIDALGNQVNPSTGGYDWNNPTIGNIYIGRNVSQKAPFNKIDNNNGYGMPGTSMEESVIQHEVNHRLNSLQGSPLSSARQSPLYDESYKYHNSFFSNAPSDNPFNAKFEDESFREYATQPFEIKSQKAQLEQALSNAGIWDPSKGSFTQADVDKMIESNITFNKGFGYLPRGLGVDQLVEGTIKTPGKLTNPMNSYSEYIGDKFDNFLGTKGSKDFNTDYFYEDKDNPDMRNISTRPFEAIKRNLESVDQGGKKWNEWSDEIKTATTQYYNARGDSQGIKDALKGEYPNEKTEALLLKRGIKVGPDGWYEPEMNDQINTVLNEYQEITNTFENTRDLISDKRPKEEGLFGAFGPIKNFKGRKAEREAVKRFNKVYKTDYKEWRDIEFAHSEGDVSQADKNIKEIVTETSLYDDIKTSFDREIETLQDLQKTGGHENRKDFYKNDFEVEGDFRLGRRTGKGQFNIELANDYMNSLKNNPDTNKEGTDVFDNSYVPSNIYDNAAGYRYFDRAEGKRLREQGNTNFKTAVDNDVWRNDLFTQAVLNLRANDRDAFIEYYNQDSNTKYTTKKEIKQQTKLLKQLKSSMPDIKNFLEKKRTETSNFIKDNNRQYEIDKEQQLINDNLSNEKLNQKISPNLIKFMNEVAMEDGSMPTNLAKYGGSLPQAQFGRNSIMSGNAYGLRPEGSTGVLGDVYEKTGFDKFAEKYIPKSPQHSVISGLLDILSVPASLVSEGVEYFGERGDKEFNFMDAMPGFSGDFSFTNANGEPIKTVSQTTGADGKPLVENFWGALALDIFTDPSTYIGAGLIKNAITKGPKVIPKIVSTQGGNFFEGKRLNQYIHNLEIEKKLKNIDIGEGGSQIKKTDLEVYINPKTGEIEQFHSLGKGKVNAKDLQENLPWEIDYAGGNIGDDYSMLLKKIKSQQTPYKRDASGFIDLGNSTNEKVISYGPWKNQKGGSIPQAQWGALGQLIKQSALKAPKYLKKILGKTDDEILASTSKSATSKSARGTVLNEYGQILTSFDDKLNKVPNNYNEILREGVLKGRGPSDFKLNVRGVSDDFVVQVEPLKKGTHTPEEGMMQLIKNNKKNWNAIKNNTDNVDKSMYDYFIDMSMQDPLDAGSAMKFLEEYIPKGSTIGSNASLSLDSYRLMLNRIKRGKFSAVPNAGRIDMNVLSKNLKGFDVNSQGMITKGEADDLVTQINKMLDETGISERALATKHPAIPHPFAPELSEKLVWKVDLPNLLLKMEYEKGGPVKAQKGRSTDLVPSIQDNTFIPSRSQIIVNEDEKNRKDNQVLGLTNIINYLVESRGGDQSIWTNLADNVAFHESGAQQRMDPQARQITSSGKRDGLGRGMFQFEPKSFKTAQKRYKNVANAVGYTLDENILNAESALDLSAKDQYTLFFANLIESPAVLKDYGDGKLSMTDVWLTGHKNVSKPGNRASFAESQEAAKKELGEKGYLQFNLEDLLPYKKGGEAHMFSTYQNYINGKTTSKDAIKIYDKLNRRYLKQARELGMSPANYVMTYIIGNS